jgi:hypothetical protein
MKPRVSTTIKPVISHLRRLLNHAKEIPRQLVTGMCVFSQLGLGFLSAAPAYAAATAPSSPSPATPAAEAAPKVTVNRTVPKVEPPRSGLEFSAQPSVEEIFRARIFQEPLVPIGGEPPASEDAALAAALRGYAKRANQDDFSSLTDFLAKYPKSPWRAALLTDLGLEYYNTAHYSLTMKAWSDAWLLAKDADDARSKAIADRTVGELACMYARLGRMKPAPHLQTLWPRATIRRASSGPTQFN